MPLRTTSLALSAIALLALAGCHTLDGTYAKRDSQATPSAAAPRQICNDQAANSFVGKTNTAANLEAARKRAGAGMARVLHPGQVTTREFNAERLNLEVDASGRILAGRCG